MSKETNNINATEAAAEVKAESKTKSKAKKESKGGGALKATGLAACKRHGLAEVWVTTDGQSFGNASDAKSHAANLSDTTILNVKAK